MINRNDLKKIRHLLPIDCHLVIPDRRGKWLEDKEIIHYLSLKDPPKPVDSVLSLISLEEDREWLLHMAGKRFGTERKRLPSIPS